MKRKRQGKLGSTGKGRRRRPLLSRKTRIRKGPGRKSRKGLLGKPGKKSLQLRRKRRLRRRLLRKSRVVRPVQVIPAIEPPLEPQVIPLPRIWASRRNCRRETPISRATPKHTTWGSTQVSPRASRTGISWSLADRAAGIAACRPIQRLQGLAHIAPPL